MFVALARHAGCLVTSVGRGSERLETAKRLGAAQTLPAASDDALPSQPDILSAGPFDVVIEATGKPKVWEAAVRLVRKGGTVNFFGGCPPNTTVALDTGLIHYSSLRLLASFHHTPRTIRAALALIEQGVVQARDFVTSAEPLDRLPELFRTMAAGNRAVKTLIDVG
jgi:L-iditol 2-dehydrogenase